MFGTFFRCPEKFISFCRYENMIIGIFSVFQSDVMQLTEDSTKLKLFMDVLDGTKAAVSRHSVTHFVFLVLFVDVFRF